MSRTDTDVRVISASPDRVFAALTDPDALAVWLPRDGMTGRSEHFDKRPGGSYRLVPTYADASAARGTSGADSDVVDVRFLENRPGGRGHCRAARIARVHDAAALLPQWTKGATSSSRRSANIR